MGLRPVHCLASLLVLLFCHGRGADQGAKEAHDDASRQLSGVTAKLESEHDMPELDVSTPLVTAPVMNPTTPTVTTPTAMPMTPASATPSLANPVGGGGGGGSWCVSSQSASPTAVQVALDYACGQGGADCSAIQPGGSCFNPDTVRDHASYAFNNFYQKNPVQTSCDFGGTAVLTSTNPSNRRIHSLVSNCAGTSTCQYPATSTGASVLNTSTPTTPTFGSPGYENSPPGYGNSPPLYGSMSPPDYSDNISAAAAMPGSKRTRVLSLTCFLVATVSLNLHRRWSAPPYAVVVFACVKLEHAMGGKELEEELVARGAYPNHPHHPNPPPPRWVSGIGKKRGTRCSKCHQVGIRPRVGDG